MPINDSRFSFAVKRIYQYTMKKTNHFYLHCVARLTVIIVTAEVLAMLLFDLTSINNLFPPLLMALLDGMFLILFSIYPLYRWVYTPILLHFKESQQKIEMLAEALQGAGESILITNPNGEIIYVNQAFIDITGYTYQEVKGKNPKILQSGKQNREFYSRMWDAIINKGKWKGELWNKRKNGELYPESLDIRAISNEAGELKFLVAAFSDLTEQKRVENALIQSQKLEAVGTLVGGVAHNFNNLLAAISGKAYLGHKKAKQFDKNASFTRHLKEIQTIAFEASNLVKQLLTFARESQHDKQDLPLAVLLKDAIETVRIGIPGNIKFKINISDAPMIVHADPVHLKQAIINLINNARDALEEAEKKQISISLYKVSHNPECSHFEACHIHCKDVAVLDIIDSGSGINSADLDKLFEPFFTTKDADKGTGLGLSTAHGIIMSHNGSINVKSTFSKGSTFNICLPLIDQSDSETHSSDLSQKAELKNTGTVLLADDSFAIRNTMASLLENFGHEVIQAGNGTEAIEQYKAHKDTVSVVVTDITMPEKDGVDAVFEMRKDYPELPVIFLTGYDDPKDAAKEVLQNEITMLLNKPFRSSELGNAVEELINRNN